MAILLTTQINLECVSSAESVGSGRLLGFFVFSQSFERLKSGLSIRLGVLGTWNGA